MSGWDLSCPDWQARIRDGRSLVPALPLERKAADRALSIFNRLKLPDVPGTPTLGEAGAPWFRDIVAAIFGSIDPAIGRRQVHETLVVVPKKSSKTTNSAGLMITAMLTSRRPRAEFLLVGPTQATAERAFEQAEGMIEADPLLAQRFQIQRHLKKITYRGKVPSTLRIRTFSTKIITGAKPVGILVDELHELGKEADADRVIGQLRGGIHPFPEGFMVMITTQSDEPPAGVFAAELMAARMIRDGTAPANGMLPVIYEFPEEIVRSDAWRDPANWPMVLPNLGRSCFIDRLIEDWETAQIKGDREIRRWASQHLNLQIGIRLMSDAWAGAAHWQKCAEPELTLDALLERSEVVVIGIDGGGLDDLLGLAVIGRERDTGKWLHWAHAWCHRSVLELRKDIASALQDFEADKDLTIVERVGDDVIEVADIVERVAATGLLPEKDAIGLDPVGIGEVIEALAGRNIDVSRDAGLIQGIPQGWQLTGAIHTLERKLAGGDFAHGGTRLMNFCVGNAKVEPRGNAIIITKQAAGKAKIDPLAASFNAVALLMKNPAGAGSIFDNADWWEPPDPNKPNATATEGQNVAVRAQG